MAVYNYDMESGDFAGPGDSGSLIFTGEGDALAMLDAGMALDGHIHNHVTFCTPIWWVIKGVRERYPHANFYDITHLPN